MSLDQEKNLQEQCNIHRNGTETTPNPKNFLIDPIHKVAYCFHGKVVTTTWYKHFSNLLPEEMQKKADWKNMDVWHIHNQLKTYFSYEKINENFEKSVSFGDFLRRENYYVFSFVRHPFDRLVSAYINKVNVEASLENPPYRKQNVVKYFGTLNFENYLKYVLKELHSRAQCKKFTARICKDVSVHWRPYDQQCAYCAVTHNFIGRMENFGSDVAEVVTSANLTNFITIKEALELHDNPSSNTRLEKDSRLQSHEAVKASQRTFDYFQNVDQSLIKELINFYELDFAFFHYSTAGFLK